MRIFKFVLGSLTLAACFYGLVWCALALALAFGKVLLE